VLLAGVVVVVARGALLWLAALVEHQLLIQSRQLGGLVVQARVVARVAQVAAGLRRLEFLAAAGGWEKGLVQQ
tara:strand:- start:305 stop:523 length:219 start_codon:yes stop_codon:yes gene_type:complete